jgi:alkylhydroperoxidase family enzyme
MARYSRTAAEVLKQPDFDMGYVRVCVAPLAAAVHKEALAWVAAVSSAMQKGDCQQLQARLLDQIALWLSVLYHSHTCCSAGRTGNHFAA